MKHTPLFTIAVIICALISTAKAADENGELKRRVHNAARLQEIHAKSRPKFAATIRDLESHGQRPYVVCAYRSPAAQRQAKAAGNSTVSWSFHNARTAQGKPDALALDVYDNRYFWATGNDFWLMLAGAAQGHNLETGIRWKLPAGERERINALIARRDWKARYRRGFDPGHIQVTGVSLAQAKRGQRP